MFGKVLKFSYITSELALCKLSQWFMVCFGISPLLNICSYNFSITKKEKRKATNVGLTVQVYFSGAPCSQVFSE